MLTVKRLADYVGVTVRAIRHYHRIGLLPEPERTSSGYRMYGAEDIIALSRIKVLSDAGVPLSRVKALGDAGPEALADAAADIDADLRARIRELQRTRRRLADLVAGRDPFLRPEIADIVETMRAAGLSEETLAINRKGWLLVQAVYPDLVRPWVRWQQRALADPEYTRLYLRTDQARSWAPDDPRVEELARDTVAWIRTQSVGPTDEEDWQADPVAYQLVTGYEGASTPTWQRLQGRIEDLLAEGGDVLPPSARRSHDERTT